MLQKWILFMLWWPRTGDLGNKRSWVFLKSKDYVQSFTNKYQGTEALLEEGNDRSYKCIHNSIFVSNSNIICKYVYRTVCIILSVQSSTFLNCCHQVTCKHNFTLNVTRILFLNSSPYTQCGRHCLKHWGCYNQDFSLWDITECLTQNPHDS